MTFQYADLGVFLMLLVIAYFSGSIPTGVFLGKKLKGLDIREHGSKNTGATNAYRVLGPKIGTIVLLIDILKGTLPVLAAIIVYDSNSSVLVMIIALTAILGHTFSVFLDFKGGKGVATSLGVFIAIVPLVMLIEVVIFVVVVYFSKYISLGSVIGALIFPFLVFAFTITPKGLSNPGVLIFGIIISAFVIYKHKANIVRLLKGTENKFYLKKK